jgi:hypothetical protein
MDNGYSERAEAYGRGVAAALATAAPVHRSRADRDLRAGFRCRREGGAAMTYRNRDGHRVRAMPTAPAFALRVEPSFTVSPASPLQSVSQGDAL